MFATAKLRHSLRVAIKATLFTAACAASVQHAVAADETGSGLEEVVVTGFRGSLEAALDDKRASAAAIDSIKAEDIAKFPDSNLAESLQRIPGVTITRDAGEGRNLSVRGLGAQFTRVRINGMEAMSTTGGTDSSGGANRERGFDFNVFASELFGSITARKTASADVEEGSLGATVDLQTGKPFDHSGFTFVASAKAAYNDLAENTDPRVTALISNTWADGKFGALLSVAYSERNLLEEGFSTVRWDSGGSTGGYATSPVPANVTAAFHPRIPRYGLLTHEQERLGVTAALQWQPADTTLFTLDLLYSDFKANRDEQFLEAFSFTRTAGQNGKPQTIVRAGEVDANGTLVYGLFDAVDIRSENRHDELETKFSEFTLNGSHQFTDRLTLSGLVGYSKSEFENPIQTTITYDRGNTNGYSWDFRGNNRLPALNYGFDPTNPANWQFANQVTGQAASVQSEIRLRPQLVDNTFKTALADLSFEVSDNLTLKGGVNYKKFEFVSQEFRRSSETSVQAFPAGTTLASLSTLLTGFGTGLNLPAGTNTSWLMPDINAFANAFGIYCNCGTYALGSVTVANARGNNRSVTEEDTGVFFQAGFKFDIGVPVRGDLGVRYVQTDTSAQGYLPVATPTSKTVDNKYSDVLPSLNLVAELTPDLLLRLGAAKVMARPGLANLSPGTAVNLVGNLTVTTGTPDLEPIRATTVDLAAEWYFDKGSLLSAAVFYKDINSFVQNLVVQQTLAQGGFTPAEITAILSGTAIQPTDLFAFTKPQNTDGGPLKGFEINYQQQFNFLPAPWSGFGTLLNYTYVDSKIDYITNATTRATVENDLTGLSRKAYNATVYFENDMFSVRLSAAYRDSYLTRVPASNAFPTQDAEGTNETFNMDFSATYNFNEHFSFSLEGLNLTDEFNDQFIDTRSNRVVVYHHTGRQYYLGARYKF